MEEKIVIKGEFKSSRESFRKSLVKKEKPKNYFSKLCKKMKKKSDK